MDNIENAKSQLTGLGQAATTAGQQLEQAGQKGSKFGQDITKGIQPLQTGFSSAQSSMQKFSQETLQTQQSAFRLTGSVDKLGQSLPQMNSGLSDSGTAMEGLVSNTSRFEEGLSNASSETSAFTGSLSGIGDSVNQLSTDANNLGGALQNISADTGGIDGLAGSAEQLTGAFSGAGTATEDFGNSMSILNDGVTPLAGGLSETTTLTDNLATGMGTATTATEGMAASTQSAVGNVTALGGVIGQGISLVFRMQDAQLALDKANLKVARTTESARKAQVAFNSLLEKAPSNINNIATAHEGLNTAMEALTELEKAGISSGQEYSAAQEAVGAATAELRKQFAEGGGDINKFDAALNKVTNTQSAAEIATQNADKTNRNWLMTVLETPAAVAAFGGTIIQSTANLKGMKDVLGIVAGGITGKLIPALTGGATGMAGLGAATAAAAGIASVALSAFQAYPVVMSAIEGVLAKFAGENEKAAIKAKEAWDFSKWSSVGGYTDIISKLFGLEDAQNKNIEAGRKLDKQNKKNAQGNKLAAASTGELAASQTLYGNAADSAGMSSERVIGSIAALPGTLITTSAAWQDVTASMEDTAGATRLINEELNQSIDANALAAQGLLVHRDAALQNEEAISVNHLAYAQSRDTLLDLIAVENDAVASQEKLQTALNNQIVSLKEEEFSLKASIAATENLVIQKQALENATLAGEEAARTWIAGLDEAAAKEKSEIATLSSYANKFGEFPSVIEPTVESLHSFIEANEQGGQAAVDFQQKVLDAYNQLVAGAQPLFDNLTAAIPKSGKEQVEGITKAFEGLLPGVEESLTMVERRSIMQFSHMTAEIERGLQSFSTKLAAGLARGLDLTTATNNARGAFQSFLTEAQSESDSAWNIVWDNAQRIAATGSASMIEEAANAIKNNKVPAEVEKMLKAIEAKGGPAGKSLGDQYGSAFNRALMTHIDQARAQIPGFLSDVTSQIMGGGAPKQAAPTQKAATPVNVDISKGSAALQMLQSQINGLKQTTPVSILVDTKPAAIAISGLQTNINSIIGKTIPLAVDTGPAGIAISGLQSQIAAIVGKTIPLAVDTGPAGIAIQGLQTQINAIVGKTIPLVVNTGPAGIAISGLQSQIAAIIGKTIPIVVDTGAAGIAITGLQTAIDAIKQTTLPSINVSNDAAIIRIANTQVAIDGIKQKTPPIIAVNNAQGISQVTALQTKINSLKQTNIPKLTVNISQGLSAVSQLQSKINSLKGKTVTNYVNTVHRTIGAAKGFTGTVTGRQSFTVGEGGPEFVHVQPLTGPNAPKSTKSTVNIPKTGSMRGGEGGSNNQPIIIYNKLMLNEREIASLVTKHQGGNKREKHFR